MLIYLSSYPRSGNTWVRWLIRHYFDQPSSSIYPEGKGSINLVRDEDGSFGPVFLEYKSRYPPFTSKRILVNGCGPILTEEFRRELSASNEHFFLKTHELPYRKYFDNEYVIHLVRHPAAVFWSYYHYIQDYQTDLASGLTVEAVIEGRVPLGPWSTYIERWLECGKILGDRFLLYSFEQLASSETEFCEKFLSFIGLPISTDRDSFPSFSHWHSTDPKFFRSGEVDEWKSHLSESQLKLIKVLHGPTMEKLGYTLNSKY